MISGNINQSENISIRNATLADIESIMQIEYSCFESEICESKEVFLERIEFFTNGFKVLMLNKEVIGYISSEIWDYSEKVEISRFYLDHSIKDFHNIEGDELYISSMGLLPQYRGKGYGKYLFDKFIEEIIKEFSNIKSIILIVSEKWKKAKQIYEENAFAELDIINKFFNLNENGIIMRKKL